MEFDTRNKFTIDDLKGDTLIAMEFKHIFSEHTLFVSFKIKY